VRPAKKFKKRKGIKMEQKKKVWIEKVFRFTSDERKEFEEFLKWYDRRVHKIEIWAKNASGEDSLFSEMHPPSFFGDESDFLERRRYEEYVDSLFEQLKKEKRYILVYLHKYLEVEGEFKHFPEWEVTPW